MWDIVNEKPKVQGIELVRLGFATAEKVNLEYINLKEVGNDQPISLVGDVDKTDQPHMIVQCYSTQFLTFLAA